jgi:hypothetical protein
MSNIHDVKHSLIENLRILNRLPDIDSEKLYPDPPEGDYERPLFYLSYKERVKSKKSTFGMIVWDYHFDAVIEVLEDDPNRATNEDTVEQKTIFIEKAFFEGEELDFWHFEKGVKYDRADLKLEVSKFRIEEGVRDRQKNRIKASLVISF